MADPPPLHPALEPLAFLLGRWRGVARSLWSDTEMTFDEEVAFEHWGKPSIAYRQQTWAANGQASHGESGFFAAAPTGAVSLMIAQPSGVVEVSTGSVEAGRIELASISIGLAPSAKPVTATSRLIHIDGGSLRYLLRVSLNHEPLADHISGVLNRVGD